MLLHADSEDSDQPGLRPVRSESSLGAQPFCWFCHVAAHIHSDPNMQDTCMHEHINNTPMYIGFKKYTNI